MRYFISLLAAIFIVAFVGCKTEEIESRLVQTPIVVDGDLDEWRGMPFKSDKDDNAALAVCYDDNHLYVAVKFKDPMWLRAIRMKGLTIWVNNKAKKDKTIGFRFNGGPTREEMEKLMPQSGQAPGGERPLFRENGMMTDFDSIEVQFVVLEKDFWYQPTPIAQDGQNGPEVAFGMAGGIFSYEYKIPLVSSAGKFYGAGVDGSQPLLLGLKWGGVDKKDRPGGGMRLSGLGIDGGGMGGGPPPGGGIPGGMRRGEFEKYMKKHELWVKTKLAQAEKE